MEIAARDEYVTSRENLCKMEKGNWLGIEVPERERKKEQAQGIAKGLQAIINDIINSDEEQTLSPYSYNMFSNFNNIYAFLYKQN